MANVYLRPRRGLLREVVGKAELQKYMSTYGDVEKLWVAWDHRCFGFATFKDPRAAVAFIQQSPHVVNNIEVVAAPRTSQDMPNALEQLEHLQLDRSRYNHHLTPEQQRALSHIVEKTAADYLES